MTDKDNRGAANLRRVPGLKQARVVEVMEAAGHRVDSAMVSRWWNGERRPDPKFRAVLESEYGIGWRLWDEATEPSQADDLPASEPVPNGDHGSAA